MKRISKYISVIAVIAVAALVFAFSASANIAGDVNGDNKVLADDARLALRASAKLEVLNKEQADAADVDDNGEVFADDARQILRFSAQLIREFETVTKQEPISEPISEPVSEPISEPISEPEDESDVVPEQVKALLDGNFGFTGELINGSDKNNATVYTNGSSIRMSMDGKEIGTEGEVVLIAKDEEKKNLFGRPTGEIVRKAYLVDPNKKTYLDFDSLNGIGLDISADEFTLSFNIADFGGSGAKPSAVYNKTYMFSPFTVYEFNSKTDSRKVACYVTAEGEIKRIEFFDSGVITSTIKTDAFYPYPDKSVYEIPSGYRKQLAMEFMFGLIGQALNE